MSTVFECPKCGAQQPENLANGARLYNCPSCGQAIHPPSCTCWDCLSNSGPQKPEGHSSNCQCQECDAWQLNQELNIGLKGLRMLKAKRREDESERLRLGLSVEQKSQGNTGLVIIGGEAATRCHNCGQLCTKKFCPKCGHQVADDCPKCQ